ncbi:Integral membrane protein [Mycobacterium basiliense]
MTPLLLVMIAVGASVVLFAFDSMPALFGLTQDAYLVFAAPAFSLLGLRQLYFLIDNLLYRLPYPSYWLAAILGFIGVKLMLEALHHNIVPLINGGKPVEIVEISTTMSLLVIVGVVLITTVVSLFSARGRRENAIARARRHALEYLDLHYEADPAERAKILGELLAAEREIEALATKQRTQSEEDELTVLLRRAHAAHIGKP